MGQREHRDWREGLVTMGLERDIAGTEEKWDCLGALLGQQAPHWRFLQHLAGSQEHMFR